MLKKLVSSVIFRAPAMPTPLYGFSSPSKNPNDQWKVSAAQEDTNKTSYHISKNVGLSRFLTRTYNTTGISIAAALGVGYMASLAPIMLVNPLVPVLGGGITAMISFIAVFRMKYNVVEDPQQVGGGLRAENSLMRVGIYGLGVCALGLSGAPLFAMANMIDPSILPSAIAITSAIFGGASLAAYSMPKDKMIGYGRVLTGSLIGLIALQLVGLGSLYFVGPNVLSALLFSVQNYLGIALFTGFIAYDTHLGIKMYEQGIPDHLGVSIQFLLDFWNILIDIISIMSRNK